MLKSKKHFGLIILLLFFVIALYGLMHGNIRQQNSSEIEHPKIKISSLPDKVQDSVREIEERIVAENMQGLFYQQTITSSTPLVLKIKKAGEHDFSPYVTSMPDSFVGLTDNQLKSVLGKWQLEQFIPEKSLVISRTFLSEHQGEIYLGVKDGDVAIFERSEDELTFIQKTELAIETLPELEQKALIKGIKVESEEELFTVLEGLLSYSLD